MELRQKKWVRWKRLFWLGKIVIREHFTVNSSMRPLEGAFLRAKQCHLDQGILENGSIFSTANRQGAARTGQSVGSHAIKLSVKSTAKKEKKKKCRHALMSQLMCRILGLLDVNCTNTGSGKSRFTVVHVEK